MKKNVIVGQSGGPTAVINASLYGVVYEALMQKEQIGTVYGMINGIEGFLADTIMNMNSVEQSGELELIKTTPGSFLGSCRYKLPEDLKDDVYPLLFKKFEEYSIGYFFYIGGNDSMDTVKMLSDYAAAHNKPQRFMGVPKTIDNDLPVTDHCPGYGSAAKYIATSMKEIIRDNESFGVEKPTVCIVEIMGRHAGWLTAAAALSRGDDCTGPDAIYLPEVTFDMDKFMEKVKHKGGVEGNFGFLPKGVILACVLWRGVLNEVVNQPEHVGVLADIAERVIAVGMARLNQIEHLDNIALL